MTNQEKEAQLQAILTDESAVAKLVSIQSVEDAQKVFTQYGLDVSVEETDAIIGSIVALASKAETRDTELDEEELMSVSGGWGLCSTAGNGLKYLSEIFLRVLDVNPWGPIAPRTPVSPWRP